jgi:hypothetical protein
LFDQKGDFTLQYTSYTSLKIVYDQQIREALERSRFSSEKATQKRGLPQTDGASLTHFSTFSARKPQATSPSCDGEVKEMVS